jgi:photosystem II stability/assembly factor-like uncharacterized protein
MKTSSLFLLILIMSINQATNAQPYWDKIANFNAYSFAFNSMGDIYIGSDSGTAYRSTDFGNTFELLDIRPTAGSFHYISQFKINSQNVLFAYVTLRGLHHSSDSGLTWPEVNATDFATDLLIDVSDNVYLSVSNANILFSSDNGINWTNLPRSSVHGLTINNAGHLFAGTYNQGIYRSTDNGSTWQNVLLAGNITCWHLEVTPDQKIHALYGSYFVSEDGGNNWTNRPSPGPSLPGPMTKYGNDIFVGHLGGHMYRTSDAGLNWVAIDTSGLGGAKLDVTTENTMAIDQQGYLYIYCRVSGNPSQTGVYRSTQSVSGLEDLDGKIPADYVVQQNYPNPFNPSTTIQFSIPEQSFVKLEVFNTLGEKVSTLVSENLNTGTYKYDWEAANLSSGVYLYRLQTAAFSTSKKMILLR